MRGLTPAKVAEKRAESGENTIVTEKKTHLINIFFRQFKSFVVGILFLTGLISLVLGHLIEAGVITSIILIVVFLNFIMEYKATKEIESLIRLVPHFSNVMRDGESLKINSIELVPGDIVHINRGDIIGADLRLIECQGLTVNESTLTGESLPVEKDIKGLKPETILSKMKNMVFAGTQATGGSAIGVVVAIGKETEFGRISTLIKDIEVQTTPLQKRLDKLTKQVAMFAGELAVIAFIIGLFHGNSWETMLIFSMAIIVSGIPESLPTVVAITLALGVKRMAGQNAIVKRLPAVETLGACSVICTDKTGTLTQNKMMVENIFTCDSVINVTGEGYSPEGIFLEKDETIDAKNHSAVSKMLTIGLLCNNSDIRRDDQGWVVDGEPTEGALVALARKAGMVKIEYHDRYKRTKEHAFDPNRKIMSTIHRYEGKEIVYSKGAPEFLLEKASHYLDKTSVKRMSKEIKEKFLRQNKVYAGKGFRVLGLAYKEHKGSYTLENVEKELVFVGLVSIRDPPDPMTIECVRKCKEAGIKVVMITGDSKATAKAIAKELQIMTDDDNILTGEELDKIDSPEEEREFLRVIDSVAVYARTTPEHKLRIVESLQKKGHIVAMTGDGVNDAPALKKADIGIAMGLRGSDVAKASSEIILKDDKFSTIVKAVEEGRIIYDNIRKFIYYLLVGSISEVLIILFAVLAGVNLPLTALMVFFINLVTSEFPAIGLSVEKGAKDILKQKPRDPRESILNDFLIMRVMGVVPVIIAGSLSLYFWEISNTHDIAKAQTVTFVTIILFELLHTLNAKTWNESIFNRSMFSNKILLVGITSSFLLTLVSIYHPFFQGIFGTVGLGFKDWVIVGFVSFMVVLFVEIKKYVLKVEISERDKNEIFPTRG